MWALDPARDDAVLILGVFTCWVRNRAWRFLTYGQSCWWRCKTASQEAGCGGQRGILAALGLGKVRGQDQLSSLWHYKQNHFLLKKPVVFLDGAKRADSKFTVLTYLLLLCWGGTKMWSMIRCSGDLHAVAKGNNPLHRERILQLFLPVELKQCPWEHHAWRGSTCPLFVGAWVSWLLGWWSRHFCPQKLSLRISVTTANEAPEFMLRRGVHEAFQEWGFCPTSRYPEAFPVCGQLLSAFHTGVIHKVGIPKDYSDETNWNTWFERCLRSFCGQWWGWSSLLEFLWLPRWSWWWVLLCLCGAGPRCGGSPWKAVHRLQVVRGCCMRTACMYLS